MRVLLMLTTLALFSAAAFGETLVNVDKKSLAIKGYDPVTYFPDYGGKPAKGDKKIVAEHEGATYRFVSEINRDAFRADPEAFAPAYGGWCAYAMADGKTVRVDLKRYEVHDGRLFLFYRDWLTDTLKPWQKNRDKLREQADAAWSEITEESHS